MVFQAPSTRSRIKFLVLPFALAVLVVAAQPAFAGAAIANGSGLYLGVNMEGHLNFATGISGLPANAGALGVSTTFADGSVRDATAPGCLCEGWGVAANGISGYANVAVDGVVNLTTQSFTSSGSVLTPFGALATSATSVTTISTLSALRVTQAYSPSAATPDLFEALITIQNTGTTGMTDIRYRRVMDWDVPPTEFYEYVTHGGLPAANVLAMGNNGFATANPLAPNSTLGCPADVNFADCGPFDHGTVIDFGFGNLAAGASTTFSIFYGASSTQTGAFAALSAVGAEVYSLGQSAGDPTGGTPATFIFAFKGVGGTPVTVPEPTMPAEMLVLGLCSLGGWLLARRRTGAA